MTALKDLIGFHFEKPTQEELEKLKISEEEDRKKESIKRTNAFIERKIGLEFVGKVFNGFEFQTEDIRKQAVNFLENQDRDFIVFNGKPGTGKTHLAAALIYRFVTKSINSGKSIEQTLSEVNYFRASDFIETIKNMWKHGEDTEYYIKFQNNFKFLIIDEVGVSYGTETEENIFNRLIDDRYRNRKGKTIIISNLDESGLEKYIGFRSLSRIYQRGIICNFQGSDKRAVKKITIAG
ncbi:MAG: hypothetical protein A2Y41_07185 [Spirochaetes bacterium GWB1_36_13]|nr:MAG: hypothetical protein A2Y41_07185 [Spirochaetes bacterium GWB1_36_13]